MGYSIGNGLLSGKTGLSPISGLTSGGGLSFSGFGGGGVTYPYILDFASGTMPSGITFARASSATFVNSSGLIQTAAINVPRIDYNPSTLTCLGLLIEPQGTNLLTSSNSINDGNYDLYNVSLTANSATSPDGTSNATSFIPSTASGFHLDRLNFGYGAGGSYTYSIYVKAAGYSQVALRESWNTGGAAVFNLNTGTVAGTYVGTGAGDTGTPSNAAIQSLPNGWYRISFTCSTTFTSQGFGFLVLDGTWTSGDPLSISWSGNGTSGVYVWGAQQEEGSILTSIIPTTTTTVTRNQDTAHMTGTNFSSWYNQSEGTWLVQYDLYDIGGVQILVEAQDATQSVEQVFWSILTQAGYLIYTGGVVFDEKPGVNTVNTTHKLSGAYALNSFATCFDNGTVLTSASGTPPSNFNQLSIGSKADNGTNMLGGHIAKIEYYNTRLSDAQVQSLTA